MPEIIKVPISSTDFFIIENRRKVSQYDVYMLGDTSQVDPFRNTGDYGKGVYITHNNNIGLNYAGPVDIECADGLWNWSYKGTTTPDWSATQQVDIYIRTSIPSVVNNNWGTFNSHSNSDGVSACAYFSIGKRHTQLYSPGIDRIHTNFTEYWTSREIWGDRWDAWNVGYNEIFSPYSNPNTKAYDNSQSGIYIWYKDYNPTGKTALLEIYKVGENGETDSSILAKTPPSRPMWLKADSCVSYNNEVRPYLTWLHNMEPDMIRDEGEDDYKRYNIYRSTSPDYNTVPSESNYTLINTVDILANETPYYIDSSLMSACYLPDDAPCPPFCWIVYQIRYRVQAVDIYDSVSVKSDFAQTTGKRLENGGSSGGNEGDHLNILNNETPDMYDLKQNYPNPFNPVTNIQFDLPFEGIVSIKIYDVTGKEVAVLVNEFKKAGSYIVSFNGSKLSSGVYFYKIETGSFTDLKRMVLVK